MNYLGRSAAARDVLAWLRLAGPLSCYSQEWIARDLGYTRTTVTRAFGRIEASGAIVTYKTQRRDDGTNGRLLVVIPDLFPTGPEGALDYAQVCTLAYAQGKVDAAHYRILRRLESEHPPPPDPPDHPHTGASPQSARGRGAKRPQVASPTQVREILSPRDAVPDPIAQVAETAAQAIARLTSIGVGEAEIRRPARWLIHVARRILAAQAGEIARDLDLGLGRWEAAIRCFQREGRGNDALARRCVALVAAIEAGSL